MEEQKTIEKDGQSKGPNTNAPKGIWTYVLLVSVGLLGSILLFELLLRSYYYIANNQHFGLAPARSTLELYDNEHIGHAFIPDQDGWFVTHTNEYYTKVTVNSHGWPDVEHTHDKPEDVYRILILGDSFVENLQVPTERRFFRQLEMKLNDSNYAEQFGKRKVEVIALGRGNTGTNQQYLILKNYGLQYQPDLVLHAFLTANDIKNNSPELEQDPYLPFFELEDEELIQLPHSKRDNRPYASIKDQFKDLRTIELFLRVRQTLQETRQSNTVDYPVEYHVYDRNYNEEYKHAWGITKQLLLKSKRSTEESGATYKLIVLANNEQVNTDVWGGLLESYPEMKNADLSIEKPEEIVNDFCQDRQLDCYFMLPYFQKYLAKNPELTTHYRFDGHWNEVGTNLAAEFLYSVLSND